MPFRLSATRTALIRSVIDKGVRSTTEGTLGRLIGVGQQAAVLGALAHVRRRYLPVTPALVGLRWLGAISSPSRRVAEFDAVLAREEKRGKPRLVSIGTRAPLPENVEKIVQARKVLALSQPPPESRLECEISLAAALHAWHQHQGEDELDLRAAAELAIEALEVRLEELGAG